MNYAHRKTKKSSMQQPQITLKSILQSHIHLQQYNRPTARAVAFVHHRHYYLPHMSITHQAATVLSYRIIYTYIHNINLRAKFLRKPGTPQVYKLLKSMPWRIYTQPGSTFVKKGEAV